MDRVVDRQVVAGHVVAVVVLDAGAVVHLLQPGGGGAGAGADHRPTHTAADKAEVGDGRRKAGGVGGVLGVGLEQVGEAGVVATTTTKGLKNTGFE